MQWKKTMAATAAALMMTLALTGCGDSLEDKYASQYNSFNESLSKVEVAYKGKRLSSADAETVLREGVKATYKLRAFEKKNQKELTPMLKQLSQEEKQYQMAAVLGALDEIGGNMDKALGNSVNNKQMNAGKQKQEEYRKWQKEHEALLKEFGKSAKLIDEYYGLFYLVSDNMRAREVVDEAVMRIGNAHQWDSDVNIDKLSFQEIFGAKSVKQLMAKGRKR